LVTWTPSANQTGAYSFSVCVFDGALSGDCEQITVTVGNGDTTNPTISAAVTAPASPNAAGWYNTAVTIHFTCADADSGIPANACPADQVLSVEGAAVASTAQTVTDTAGNVSDPSNVVTVKIDKTAPRLSPVVSPNPIILNGVAAASSGATDTLSGVASQSCGTLVTNSVGSKTVTCTATDGAGNLNSANASYSVIYNFTGFFQPVDNPGPGQTYVFNRTNAGKAIPVKFSLNGNQGLNIFATGYPALQIVSCSAGGIVDDIEQTFTAGSSSLSYDAATNQYTYVWKTDKTWTNSCRKLTVKFIDGTEQVAYFNLIK